MKSANWVRIGLLSLACAAAAGCNDEALEAAKKKAEAAQQAADATTNELHNFQDRLRESQAKVAELESRVREEAQGKQELSAKLAQAMQAQQAAETELAKLQEQLKKPVEPTEPVEKAAYYLQNGKVQNAISDMQAFQKSLPNKGKVFDPTWANSNHVIAVGYMRMGQYDKAKEPMEAVTKSGKTNRSIVVNQAVCDVGNKVTVVRAVKSLRPLVMAHPEDEEALNLWACAIQTTLSTVPNADIRAEMDDFEKANVLLEKAHPGKHHWGSTWISDSEFQQIQKTRRLQQDYVDQARSSYESAASNYNALAGVRTSAAVGSFGGQTVTHANTYWGSYYSYERSSGTPSTGVSEAQLNAAWAKVSTAKAWLDRELAKMPKPTWAVKVEPVAVELLPTP